MISLNVLFIVAFYMYSLLIFIFVLGMDDGFLYSCDMCNFKTIRKDIYMLHIVKHKEETIQNYGICEPLVPLDEVSYDTLVTYLYLLKGLEEIIYQFIVLIL